MKFADSLKRLVREADATTAIEYALICGLIVLVMVVGFSGFGSATRMTWGTISNQMDTAVNQSTGG
jgi:pilus assembly protein Flp/PilA